MSEISTILPEALNFSVWKGDTFKKTLSFFDASNAPLDLSTASVKMQIRKKAGEPVLESISSGYGITVVSNQVSIEKMINIEKGTYRYDLEVTYASGIVRTYLSGLFKVSDDITRSE